MRQSVCPKGHSDVTKAALAELLAGNERYANGEKMSTADHDYFHTKPYAMLIGTGDALPPVEKLFDARHGSVVVQRTMGGISNTHGDVDTATNSVEYAVLRYSLKVAVIVCDPDSKLVRLALGQVQGAEAPSGPLRRALTDMTVTALRAVQQVETEDLSTSAARERKRNRLTSELNAFYAIEQLLLSPIIRNGIRNGLELHVGMFDPLTCKVHFVGEHPMVDEICSKYEETAGH